MCRISPVRCPHRAHVGPTLALTLAYQLPLDPSSGPQQFLLQWSTTGDLSRKKERNELLPFDYNKASCMHFKFCDFHSLLLSFSITLTPFFCLLFFFFWRNHLYLLSWNRLFFFHHQSVPNFVLFFHLLPSLNLLVALVWPSRLCLTWSANII